MVGGTRSGPVRPGERSVPAWTLALPVLAVVVALTIAVADVTLGSGSRTPSVGAGQVAVGAKAPAFTSWDLSDREVALSTFRGKGLVITFWATWCTACRDELPQLQRIRDTYRSSDFAVLAVDYRETDTGRMKQYLAGLGVNLEAVIDPQGAISTAYRVDIGLPVNIWLDRDQVVSQIMIGARPETDLVAAASRVAGPAPPA